MDGFLGLAAVKMARLSSFMTLIHEPTWVA
jgi:hypothetical protein